jgi:hypothetical protein
MAVPTRSAEASQNLKIFISYSRRDMASADALVSALEQCSFEVLIDRRDLPYGEEWQKELADFIRNSDTVVWLVSPDSVASKWCKWELGELGRLHKRLVTVKIKETDIQSLPESIGNIHLFPIDGIFSIDEHFDTLVQVLNADRVWLKEGTRLAGRAQAWLQKRRNTSLLLHGVELTDAETWINRKPRMAPEISTDVLNLVLESRRASSRRQKWAVGGALVVAAISLSLAVMAFEQRNEALVSQSLFLAKLSRDNTTAGDAATALLLALAALPTWKSGFDRPIVADAIRSLYYSLFSLREAAVFAGHEADVNTVAFHPSEQILLTSSDDYTARTWNSRTGQLLHVLKGHRGKVTQAIFSNDGRLIATASDDGTAKIWTTATGQLAQTLVGHADKVNSVEFDGKGLRLLTSSDDGTARIWTVTDDAPSIILRGHTGAVNSASFSPDGLSILTTSSDDSAALWDSRSGKLFVKLVGHTEEVIGGAFNIDGSMIVTFSHDNTARLWNVESGKPLRILTHDDWVRSAAFCPTKKCVVTASDDKTARVWEIETGGAIVLQNAAGVRKGRSATPAKWLQPSLGTV